MTTADIHQKKLYLIPSPLAKSRDNLVLPEYTVEVTKGLSCFVVEKIQSAQSFLQWLNHPVPLHEITFRVLNKRTPDHEIISFLNLLKTQSVGLISEAGAPGVADPGAKFTKLAHEKNIPVVPLVGPSSILLALMASGLNGQQFSFHGYLPIHESKRAEKITDLEKESFRTGTTHIIMETPHRNNMLLSLLLDKLRSSSKLCIAANLTSKEQFIKTKSIRDWKALKRPDLQKIPALFLINAK